MVVAGLSCLCCCGLSVLLSGDSATQFVACTLPSAVERVMRLVQITQLAVGDSW